MYIPKELSVGTNDLSNPRTLRALTVLGWKMVALLSSSSHQEEEPISLLPDLGANLMTHSGH